MTVEEQAKKLAAQNKATESKISEIYWFPDEKEVRLVEVLDELPLQDSDELEVIYFNPEPDMPHQMAIGLVHPRQFKRLTLPHAWGTWETGRKLEIAG
ncbi:MAG TPA: hypothetical protein VEJ63_16785 [Planctomycetota bacterium]|nr:hypothetical protein [Planctomycetota bacterium]